MKISRNPTVWLFILCLFALMFCLALLHPAHAALSPQEVVAVAKKMQILQMENASLRKELAGAYVALQQIRSVNDEATKVLQIALSTKVSQDALMASMLERANARIDTLQQALEETTRDLQVLTKDRNFWRGVCTFGVAGVIGYGVAP